MESHLVLDTNIFLQCRKLDELPWPSICAAETIVLIPAPTALDEIDKLKFDANKRRARRAREVTGLFRKVLLADHQVLEWTVGSTLIQLKFAPPLGRSDELRIESILRPDHRIVEEAVALRDVLGLVRFCSDDTGACLRAMRRGVAFVLAPEDWRLSETDPLERENSGLKEELAKEREKAPRLECALANESSDHISIDVPRYAPLDAEIVAAARDQICVPDIIAAERAVADANEQFEAAVAKFLEDPKLAHNARRETVARERARREVAGQKLQTARQRLDRARRWSRDVESTLTELPAALNSIARSTYIALNVSNVGARPATEARLLVRTHGGIRLLNQEQIHLVLGEFVEQLPSVRSPFAGLTYANGQDGPTILPMERIRRSSHYDRITGGNRQSHEWFLRKDAHADEEHPTLIFECADFRHSNKPANLGFVVEVFHDERDGGTIELELTANNASLTRKRFSISSNLVPRQVGAVWLAAIEKTKSRAPSAKIPV